MTSAILRRCLAVPLFAVCLAATAVEATAEPVTLTLVTTNDLDRMDEKDGRGGLARLAAVVAAERAKGGQVLFLHAGDAISPSLMSVFDQGAHMIELLNLAKPDIFVPGNHEFDFGPEVFEQRLAEADFPIVAANLRSPAGRLPQGVLASVRLTVGDVPVGIVGVMLDDVADTSSPGDYSFLPPLQVAEETAKALRKEGAELVIAVSHTPLEQDLDLVRSGAFEVVVSGDDHLLITLYDGRTVLMESGDQADRVNVLQLTLDREGDALRWTPEFRIVDTAAVTPVPALAERIGAYQASLSRELDVAIGTTATDIDSRRTAVRGGEAVIGNLIADAMREMTGAEVALTNGGGIRGNKLYPAGSTLTARDILSELPFGNRTVLLEVTGLQLLSALENGFSQVEEAGGRFPQVSGMTVEASLAQPVGSRVTSVEVAGLRLDPDRRYSLATNDFLARGGDGYEMLTLAETIVPANDGGLLANQVIAYLRSMGYVAPQIEGRIQLK